MICLPYYVICCFSLGARYQHGCSLLVRRLVPGSAHPLEVKPPRKLAPNSAPPPRDKIYSLTPCSRAGVGTAYLL